MNKIKLLFENKMYLISLTPFVLILKPYESGVYGINKTVGWAFDITGISFFIPIFC